MQPLARHPHLATNPVKTPRAPGQVRLLRDFRVRLTRLEAPLPKRSLGPCQPTTTITAIRGWAKRIRTRKRRIATLAIAWCAAGAHRRAGQLTANENSQRPQRVVK